MPTDQRPLLAESTADLRRRAEAGLQALGEVLEELVHRSGNPGTRLFDDLRRRRPPPGRLEPSSATRRYSVYVIELDPSVLERGAFARANRKRLPGKDCLYVGMTAHTPEKRFLQHRAGENAGKFVEEFGRTLRPDLYEERNPLTKREAIIEEKALARELRDAGYAVWQN